MKLTKTQVTEYLNNFFSDEFEHWEVDTRKIWVFQAASGTGKYMFQENLNYTVAGIIGSSVEIENEVPGVSVTFKKEGSINRVPYTMLTTIEKMDGSYKLVKYWDYLYNNFFVNMDKMRGTTDYAKALEVLGVTDATDEEVALAMSTQYHTLRKDVPDVAPELMTLDVTVTEDTELNRYFVNGVFKIDGEVANPLKWMWYIVPKSDVPGIPGSAKAAGAYVGGRSSFFVNNDFTDRKSVTLMSTKSVDIKCYVIYKEADGDLKPVNTTINVDMSNLLPQFDYFDIRD